MDKVKDVRVGTSIAYNYENFKLYYNKTESRGSHMKRNIVPILLIVASVGFAILSFFILPESVIIQFSIGSSGNTAAPKLLAILIPFALSVGGAISGFLTNGNENSKSKGLLVSLVGIILFVIMIAVNCLVK